jgi:two-component SAPR family response regulator
MEKKRLLDACRKTIILIVPALLLAACSLPRILVLHDPLNSQEHIDLGVSYEKRGEFSAAIKEYEEAAKDLSLYGQCLFPTKELRCCREGIQEGH